MISELLNYEPEVIHSAAKKLNYFSFCPDLFMDIFRKIGHSFMQLVLNDMTKRYEKKVYNTLVYILGQFGGHIEWTNKVLRASKLGAIMNQRIRPCEAYELHMCGNSYVLNNEIYMSIMIYDNDIVDKILKSIARQLPEMIFISDSTYCQNYVYLNKFD